MMASSFTVLMVTVFGVFAIVVVGIGIWRILSHTRRSKEIERSLKMVSLLVKLPPLAQDKSGMGDQPANSETLLGHAEQLFTLLAGTTTGKTAGLYNQRHLGLEIVAWQNQVYFYVLTPISLLSTVEKSLSAAYPDVQIDQVNDYNIFSDKAKIGGVTGGEFRLAQPSYYPINDYKKNGKDSLAALLNGMSRLQTDEGAAIQLLIRPVSETWSKNAHAEAAKLINPNKAKPSPTGWKAVASIAQAPIKPPSSGGSNDASAPTPTPPNEIDQKMSAAIEAKASVPAFESLIRVVASSPTPSRANAITTDIVSSFAPFNLPGSNQLQFKKADQPQKLATDFIWRFFPSHHRSMVLSSTELASLFHLPNNRADSGSTPVERTGSREIAAPAEVSTKGLILGSNIYRGHESIIKLSDDDRRRHVYIVGQTGTGKSVTLENSVVQDMAAGRGLAFIDPHGDTAEKLLAKVPPSRAQDVIYFNPADTDQPMGLNLLQFDRPEQKDFLIQETINMLYKLYDPQGSGIIGPRFEHWFRNAALTIMADPDGATFLEIPKVFTDNDFLKKKFKYITDPTVQDFWTKEMAQTSDYHKSEMLGWFVSKFGAFASNDIMRNIIGQKQSAFDMRQIMDEGKILIVNLSKGLVGELNSKLLGMIFVIKFQAAAMGRAEMPEDQRRDFTLYVDEFQNFSTDSFASILSEARKYRLSLVVANQFIGQLNEQVREAVFGNVGTILSLRCGPEDAEVLAKQFEPSFAAADLVNLPNLHGALRLMSNGLPSTPFSLKILFPPVGEANDQVAKAVIEYSRTHYGKPKAIIDAAILASLRPSTPPPPVATSAPTTAPTSPNPAKPPEPTTVAS